MKLSFREIFAVSILLEPEPFHQLADSVLPWNLISCPQYVSVSEKSQAKRKVGEMEMSDWNGWNGMEVITRWNSNMYLFLLY